MYEVYAYWNAEQVTAVLNALALIMNGGDYLGLIKALAIAGILIAAGTALVRMRGEEPLGYFVMFALFYGTLFVPKATVTVKDLRTSTFYTVANVPLGVAFFASQTSHIGKWLTETFETNFTAVDDVKFEKTGMAFGARLVEQLQMVKVRTPALQQDLIAFVKDCVNPELLDNPTALNDMVKSTDLWGFIGGSGTFSLNPGRSTIVANTPKSCAGVGGAYQTLSVMLALEVSNQTGVLGDLMNSGNPAATTIILSQIPAIEALMLNVSRTAQDSIKQSMVMNLMRDSQTTVAQLQGNPQAAQVALAVAMAEQSSAVSYAAMAKVAQGALPKLRNAIELVVIGVFPIMFMMIVIAGVKAGLVLRSYVMVLFWVQLWAPLYAIINFMATKADAADLMGVLHGTGGNTLENMNQLREVALSNQSIAGMLTISVPIIALALVKGGEVAMSGVVSSIMSPAQGAAQKAGDSVGQGNVNAGNVSWGNTNANNWSTGNWGSGNTSFNNAGGNKQDLSSSWADPQMSTATNAKGSVTRDGQGNITGMRATPWSMGGSVGGGTTLSRGNTDTSGDATRATTGRAASLDLATTATSGNRASADFSRQLMSEIARGVSQNGQWGQTWSGGTSGSASADSGGTSTLKNQDQAGMRSRLGVDAGVGARQEYGPYGASAQPGGAPGGGQGANLPGGAPSMPAGSQAVPGASSGSGGNLPVPAGAAQPGGSKAGPVKGSRSAGLDAGVGLEAATSQAVIDDAFNRNTASQRQSADRSAQVVMNAARSVAANTKDAGVRAAAESFMADFQKAVRASDQQSASVQHESSAGSTRSQGTQNQVGGNFTSTAAVGRELLAMAGGDPNKALDLAQDAAALAQATQAAQAKFASSSAGGAVLSSGGVAAPTGQGAVQAQGNADVNRLAASGRGAAARANAGNQAGVHARQPASPTSSPDTSPASAAFSSTAGAAYANYQALTGDANFSQGATAAAASLYKDEQKGMGTVLSNTYLGGAGYKSPQEYQEALTKAAASSPKLASTLKQIGASGGQVSPQAREYIQSELKSYQDAQPGFISRQLDRLTGG